MSNNGTISPKNEDVTLFLLIKQRDKDAFSVVYQKYHAYLYALALRYLKNTALAEDAVQHVFVKLWETSKNIDIDINLKNYLYTMTKNYILNQFRNNRKIISLNYATAQQDFVANDDINYNLEEIEISELLYKGIDLLPSQKKMCVVKRLKKIRQISKLPTK